MSPPPITELPPEMLGEIAIRTSLADLIHLSRTCKSLHRFLFAHNSRYIWKAKLASIEGLPACPADLSEYAYADLVSLSTSCQGCDASGCATVDWDLRVRLCQKCLSAVITTFDEARPPFRLRVRLGVAKFPSVKIRDLVRVRSPIPHGCAFVTKELDAIRAELKTMDVRTKAVFIKQRKAMMVEVRLHADQCRAWVASEVHAKIRSKRIPLIREKLISLGWGNELEIYYCFDDHPPCRRTGRTYSCALGSHSA
ncbi:F-box domain-containing protein [Mycena sanguinolenta]|uniref:F-box domain-containing protein n=1 Tax=Mycena sanguinolenta TaxID=230812 RepID=A0A8H7CKN0_9AGAR|nr:F-box domain-containing protein [Mycena sanguinolenta]